jgi:hypothetical protein
VSATSLLQAFIDATKKQLADHAAMINSLQQRIAQFSIQQPAPVPIPIGTITLIFSYAFDTTAKNQLDNGNTAVPDAVRTDVGRYGDWTTTAGRGWEIRSEAAYPGGTGLGFRNYRGDGSNNNSGGFNIILASPVTEWWMRFYMRFQSGFAWNPAGAPAYTKDIRGEDSGGTYVIYGIQGGGTLTPYWGITTAVLPNQYGSKSWSDLMGGNVGDGLWHCHEFHVKIADPNSVLEIWIDNVLVMHKSGLTLGVTNVNSFRVGDNQATPTGAGANDYYTDYDEFAVSAVGRVGPL